VHTVSTIHASIEPERIEAAQRARRCAHIKYNGQACGCPALRDKDFCRFHADAESSALSSPFIEDAAALQVAIMRIFRALEVDMIDIRRATAMLYALQIASANLPRLTEEMPLDRAAGHESMVVRLMAILQPSVEKGPYVFQELDKIVRHVK
jgi:hypothetical protein